MRALVPLLALAFAAASAFAEDDLPVPPDVVATHGGASALATPLRLCTTDDPAALQATPMEPKPVRLAWTIGEQPPGLSKVVAITSGDFAGCTAVRALPPGGVDAMKLDTPYAIVDKAPDWSKGYTALVMARKRDELTTSGYAQRLKRHVKLVTSLLESRGMDGYIVVAGETHEWAYLHWIDEDTAKRAFATPEGASGLRDSRSIQRPLPQQALPLP